MNCNNIIESYHSLTSYPDEYYSENYPKTNHHKLNLRLGDVYNLESGNDNFLNQIIKRRRSTRSFVPGDFKFEHISNLLHFIAGNECSKPHPSAGGFYPYEYIICIHKDFKKVPQGWYYYNSKERTIGQISNTFSKKVVDRIHINNVFENSVFSLYLVCQLSSHIAKYSNRGYKFAISEGGSIIQNAYLYCSEKSIGVCADGGFDEGYLLNYLNLDKKWIIPFSLVFGNLSNTQDIPSDLIEINTNKIKNALKKGGFIENTYIQTWEEFNLSPCVSSTTKFTFENQMELSYVQGDYSFGTSTKKSLSELKSLMEAYERITCSIPDYSIYKSAGDLDTYIEPDTLVRRNRDMANSLYRFSESDRNYWVQVADYYNCNQSYVLMDLVYYPLNPSRLKREPFIYRNSSGVAAHFEESKSKISAFMELIERDALMVSFYTNKTVIQLIKNSLPSEILNRVRGFEKSGVQVYIFDISLSAPTYLVLFVDKREQTILCSGASSGLYSSNALEKAFSEAEFNYMSWKKYGKFAKITTEMISEPKHHQLYYCDDYNIKKLSRYFDSELFNFQEKNVKIEQLLDKYKPIFCHLKNPLEESVFVHRCFSKHLIPIHFGFGNHMDYSHRIEVLGLKDLKIQSHLPHFFS